MTVYSYNAPRLQKKTAPKRPFWSFSKVAAAIGFSGVLLIGTSLALTPNQPAPVAVAPVTPVVVSQPAPVTSTEPVNDMPEACIRAKVTREECNQAIALYNAQQNQGPTWSGQEFNENQRKAWAQ
jgi:hypothetical protein